MMGKTEHVFQTLYSVVSRYNLYKGYNSQLTCDEVIKVPISINAITEDKVLIPCVILKLVQDNVDNFKRIGIVLETNDGVTVEPITLTDKDGGDIYALFLPPKTTGIKNTRLVCINEDGVSDYPVPNDLVFDIMPPPYNYENAHIPVMQRDIQINNSRIEQLISRLDLLSADLQKVSFLSGRGKVKNTENANIGADGFVRIVGNPRFIRCTLKHANTNPWRVDFYFSDHNENTIKTRVYIPAGDSVLLLDMITGQLCVTTTNGANVTSVTYPLPLLTKARDIPINWAWVTPTQGNLYMEVQHYE